MGMFSSAHGFITALFDQGTEVLETAGKTVSMATTYVDNRAYIFEEEDCEIVATAYAKRSAALKRELEADEEAGAIYNDMVAKLKKRREEKRK